MTLRVMVEEVIEEVVIVVIAAVTKIAIVSVMY